MYSRGRFLIILLARETKKRFNMRKSFFCYLCLAAVQISALFFASSCRKSSPEGVGNMRICFPDDMYEAALSYADLPDTNDFILDIRDSEGVPVYSGAYGDSPEVLSLSAGSYTVSVMSGEFSRPAFSAPQYGDRQCVVVPTDGTVNVKLNCVQINAGIRLRISPEFLTAFPDGVLFVSSGDGRLMYGYSEKRIAYFNPGPVSVVLNDGADSRTLFTRTLDSKEILTVDIKVSDSMSGQQDGGISVSVDTTRIWTDEDYVIGGETGNKGDEMSDAMSVSQARANIGEEDVWVCGYIVGGDLTRSSMSFSPPFSSATNLAIAARSSVSSRESCIAVSLPGGELREKISLADHPENLGRRVYFKGDIVESYFNLVGIKNVTECVLK